MNNPVINAARYAEERQDVLPRAAWVRSTIAALPASPHLRPHCAPNYLSDLGLRYRDDPAHYYRSIVEACGLAWESARAMPDAREFFDSWRKGSADETDLLEHLDALVNYGRQWRFAARLCRMYWKLVGTGGSPLLLGLAASLLAHFDRPISDDIFRSLSADNKYINIYSEIRYAIKLLKIDRSLDAAKCQFDRIDALLVRVRGMHRLSQGDCDVLQSVVDNARALMFDIEGRDEEAAFTLEKASRRIASADGLVIIEDDQKNRYLEQIPVNSIQLLLIQECYEEAIEKAHSLLSYVERCHRSSRAEALYLLGYSEFLSGELGEARAHWEHGQYVAAAYGLVTPLRNYRESLSVLYGRIGNERDSEEALIAADADPAGFRLLGERMEPIEID